MGCMKRATRPAEIVGFYRMRITKCRVYEWWIFKNWFYEWQSTTVVESVSCFSFIEERKWNTWIGCDSWGKRNRDRPSCLIAHYWMSGTLPASKGNHLHYQDTLSRSLLWTCLTCKDMTGRSKRLIDIGLPSIVLSVSNFFQIVLQAFASRHYVFKQETKLMLLVEVLEVSSSLNLRCLI